MLGLIAVFLWFAGNAENRATQFKQQVKKLSIGHVMLRNFLLLSPNDDLATVKRLIETTEQKDFPIGSREHISHVLSQGELQQALNQHDLSIALNTLPLSPVLSVDVHCPIDELIERLKQTPFKMVAVTENNRVVGIIGMQQILALANI
jgi:stage IV sporulation protein FB